MFNVMISVYLAIMTVALIGRYFPDALPNQWAKAGVLFLAALLLFVILEVLNVHLFADYDEPDLPKHFNLAGSGVFGFVSGYLTLWFLVYVFFVTPVGKADMIKDRCGQTDMLLKSRYKVDTICNTLEFLSLQEDDGNSEKLYQWLETAPEKKKKSTKKSSKKKSSSKSSDPNASEPNSIADPNYIED